MRATLRLVEDLDALRDSWERTPLVSRDLGSFDDVLSVDELQRILDGGVPLPSVRLFQNGGVIAPDRVARPRDPNARGAGVLVDSALVVSSVADGATLALEEVQSYSPTVARFAAAVTLETGYTTDCTSFVTRAGTLGAPAHYDPSSVFVRQVYGEKRWRLNAPPQWWPRQKWRPSIEIDTEPVLDVVLAEGDCLYIPRGYVHAGEATGVASVHLSIGVSAPTWGDFLVRLLRSAAGDDQSLRASLPAAFDPADRAEVFRERVADLAAVLEKLQWPDPPAGPAVVPGAGEYGPVALRAVLDGSYPRRNQT